MFTESDNNNQNLYDHFEVIVQICILSAHACICMHGYLHFNTVEIDSQH